jgi:DNA-binding CsgD family transcriptional regulator
MLEGPSSRVQVYLQVAESSGLSRKSVTEGLLPDGPLPERIPFPVMAAVLDRMAHLLGGGTALEIACAHYAEPADLAYLACAFDSQRAFSRFVCEQLSLAHYPYAPTTHEEFSDGSYRETMDFPAEACAGIGVEHALVGFVRGHARLRGLPENEVRVVARGARRVEMIITPPAETRLQPPSGRRIAAANETMGTTVRTLLATRASLGPQRHRFTLAVEALSAASLVGAPLEEYLAHACETLRELLQLTHCAIWLHDRDGDTPRPSPRSLLTWAGAPPPWPTSRRVPLCPGYEIDVPLGTDVSVARPLFSWLARRVHQSGSPERLATERNADAWRLSPRQLEVLRLVVAGHGNGTIAATLGCAVGTVEQHVGAILERSGLTSRAAVLRACLVHEREDERTAR